MGDDSHDSTLVKALRGLKERVPSDIPSKNALTADQNAKPNRPEPEDRGDLARGGREN